ncbi:MAG: HlyC/CorC family transporter [Porphyromonadaceae bacterium]|nr:HlyC/CorC family transporter [Porphyromonadaceae bacterium]
MSLIGYILLSLLGVVFFTGMETAYLAANKFRFELAKKDKSLNSSIISVFYNNSQQFIATMFVGKYLSIVVYGMLVVIALKEPFVPFGGVISIIFQIVIATIALILVGEFLPKTIFKFNPNLWIRFFSWLLLAFYIVFYPISWFTSWLSLRVFKILKTDIPKSVEENIFSRIDLNYLLQESLDSGDDINDLNNEVKIFKKALDFSTVKLRDCYVPRTEMVALEYNVEINVLMQTFIETGLSKILIYKEDIDNIVGYIHSSEMFKHHNDWKKHIKTIPFVPENMAAQKLMKIFMSQKKSIAVVVDEFGGTAGIVTLEDIVEQIFGDIEDEHDFRDYTAEKLNDSEYMLSGKLEVEEVNRLFDLSLPLSEEYTTIAGFILQAHQRFPKLNEIIRIEKYTFKCVKVTNNRIELVKLQVND